MGTNILVPDADFSASAVGFDAAVASGLQGLWFFNRGVRESRKNLALGGADAEVFGTPSDQGSFIRFKGAQSFFQTQVSDTEGLTHIVAVKSADTAADFLHSPMFVSNFGSGSAEGYLASPTSGASIYSNESTSALTMSGSRYTDGTQTDITSRGIAIAISALSSWTLVASRTSPGRAQQDNFTAVTATGANLTTGRVLAAGDFRIGSSFNAAFQGEADVAAVVMYDRYITDTELQTMAGQLRNVLGHIGIAV